MFWIALPCRAPAALTNHSKDIENENYQSPQHHGLKGMSAAISPQGRYPEPVVFRNLALPVSVFDRIKDVQRAIDAEKGTRLSIVQVVSHIIREQQVNAESEVRNHVPAILAPRYP
jgi:hypothetical protein